jgi:hypothetical protein
LMGVRIRIAWNIDRISGCPDANLPEGILSVG